MSRRALIVCLVALSTLTLAETAMSKEIRTTTCGRNECRTAMQGISGIATLPGPVAAPRTGRFYTITFRAGPAGWKVVYEQRRQIVRAADRRASTFLGGAWLRLTTELRPRFARAVRGLEPMRAAPRYDG